MINKEKLNQIINLARKCNDCAMLHFTNFSKDMINLKIDTSPVTIADLAVNQIAINAIGSCRYPKPKLTKELIKSFREFFLYQFKQSRQFASIIAAA